MGAFFASFEQMGPALPGTPGYTTAEALTTKETFRQMIKHTYTRAASQAKGFAVVGAVFAGTECVVENVRPPLSEATYALSTAEPMTLGTRSSPAASPAACSACVVRAPCLTC
jgi:hypothetical protein